VNAGPCPSCGDELASDQRYCVTCGARNESSLAPSYMPGAFDGAERGQARRGFPIPVPIATTFAAAALGFGVIMGTALSPNLSGLKAGEYIGSPEVVTQTPAEPPKDKGSSKNKGGGGGGSSSFDTSPSTSSFGSGFYGSTGSSIGTTTTPGIDNGPGGVAPPKPDKPKQKYLAGTVIHQNPVAGSYSISSDGAISAIHGKQLPSIGTKIKVPVRKLSNGTYAEEGEREKKGSAAGATFTGVVTDSRDGLVAGDPDVYTVSARGASILVFAPDPTGITPSPGVGQPITTKVEIRASVGTVFPPALPPGACPVPSPAFPRPAIFPAKQLWQSATPVLTPTPVTSTVIETTVQSTCPASAVLSSDDIRYGNSDVDLLAAPGVNPALLVPGEALMAQVTIAAGALTGITGTTSDNGAKAADDDTTGQGNLAKAASKTDARIARAAAKHARR
jgi:hypothetical protein